MTLRSDTGWTHTDHRLKESRQTPQEIRHPVTSFWAIAVTVCIFSGEHC